MVRVRFVLFTFFVFLFNLPKLVYGYLIPKDQRERRRRLAYSFVRYVGIGFLNISGAHFVTKGLEHIHQERPVLFVSNHKSQLDSPVLVKFVDYPLSFIAKEELKKIPVMYQWMKLLGCHLLNRQDSRAALKTILEGIECMKQGESIAIFPQGTRSRYDTFLPFKQGSLKLAEKSGALVVPVTIKGTDNVFENNGLNLKPETIYVTFHPPIDLASWSMEDRKKSAQLIQEIIEVEYNRLPSI